MNICVSLKAGNVFATWRL